MQNQQNPAPESPQAETPGFAELARFAAALPQDYRLALLLMLHFALDEEKASPLKEPGWMKLQIARMRKPRPLPDLGPWPGNDTYEEFLKEIEENL